MGKPTRVNIYNLTNPYHQPITVRKCTGFWQRFCGFMFQKSIPENDGLLLENNNKSRIDSAIHMLFMNFNLAVIWINEQYQVDQVKPAVIGTLRVMPDEPAKYTLETHLANKRTFSKGDKLYFEEIF